MPGRTIKLIGLDFGSTTSSAVIAAAEVLENRVSGRRELQRATPIYRSPLVFTPFQSADEGAEALIDLDAIRRLFDGWLRDSAVTPDELFGGGALITGLAARKSNAPALTALLRERLSDAVVATADDPSLESFVSFMGSCARASRLDPKTPILNLDIGGGTTNLALGLGGEVLRTGCLQVGARHLRFVPNTTILIGGSQLGWQMLSHLGIAKQTGDSLDAAEIDAVLDYQVAILCAACAGHREAFSDGLSAQIEMLPLQITDVLPHPRLAFSGGVGALIYARLSGDTQPPSTCFGDLGPHLAARIIASDLFTCDVIASENAGRATVYGLLEHTTLLSGSTLFLSQPELLPLRDLPIFGCISPCSTESELHDALRMIRRSTHGGALRVSLHARDLPTLRELALRLRQALCALDFPAAHPIVLLLGENLGKALGGYITGFTPSRYNLLVIDEVASRDARFVQLGRLREQMVPVSFHGLSL